MSTVNTKLTPYETIFLREILSFKNNCAVKASTMESVINDPDLKNLFKQDVTTAKRQMQEILGIFNSTGIATVTSTNTSSTSAH